jgi:alkanesulfonate monooxygenase
MTGQTDVLWFLPTHGDGRYLGAQEGARAVSLPYLPRPQPEVSAIIDRTRPQGASKEGSRSLRASWSPPSELAALEGRILDHLLDGRG